MNPFYSVSSLNLTKAIRFRAFSVNELVSMDLLEQSGIMICINCVLLYQPKVKLPSKSYPVACNEVTTSI